MTKKVLRATLDTQINTMEGWVKQFQEDIKHARKPSKKRALTHSGAMIEDVLNSLKELRESKGRISLAISYIEDGATNTALEILKGERRAE